MIYKFAFSNGELKLANALSKIDSLTLLDQITDLDINNAVTGTYNGKVVIEMESGLVPNEKELEYIINSEMDRFEGKSAAVEFTPEQKQQAMKQINQLAASMGIMVHAVEGLPRSKAQQLAMNIPGEDTHFGMIVPIPNDDVDYMLALHELGHTAAVFELGLKNEQMSSYEGELYAHHWALEHSQFSIPTESLEETYNYLKSYDRSVYPQTSDGINWMHSAPDLKLFNPDYRPDVLAPDDEWSAVNHQWDAQDRMLDRYAPGAMVNRPSKEEYVDWYQKNSVAIKTQGATVEDTEPEYNFGFLKEPHKELYPAAWENMKMRPEANKAIKNHVLHQLSINHYDDADDWIYFTVYGSGASFNWDEDGDFDVQMWVDYEAYNAKHHEDAAFTSDELVAEVRRIIQMANFPSFKELNLATDDCEGRMLIQFYPQPGKGSKEENLAKKPYACYDMETDEWYQKPRPITPTFYGEHFIMVHQKAQDIAVQAEGLLDELNRNTTNWQFWTQLYSAYHNDKYKEVAEDSKRNAEAERDGIKVLFEGVFGDRQKAYSPEGEGEEDEGDIVQKLLEVWGIFQKLKHYARAPLPWEEQELPEEPEKKEAIWPFKKKQEPEYGPIPTPRPITDYQKEPYSEHDFRVGPGSPQVPIGNKTRWQWSPSTGLHVWNPPESGEVYHMDYAWQMPNGTDDIIDDNMPSGYLLSNGKFFAYQDQSWKKWEPQVIDALEQYLGYRPEEGNMWERGNDEESTILKAQSHLIKLAVICSFVWIDGELYLNGSDYHYRLAEIHPEVLDAADDSSIPQAWGQVRDFYDPGHPEVKKQVRFTSDWLRNPDPKMTEKSDYKQQAAQAVANYYGEPLFVDQTDNANWNAGGDTTGTIIEPKMAALIPHNGFFCFAYAENTLYMTGNTYHFELVEEYPDLGEIADDPSIPQCWGQVRVMGDPEVGDINFWSDFLNEDVYRGDEENDYDESVPDKVLSDSTVKMDAVQAVADKLGIPIRASGLTIQPRTARKKRRRQRGPKQRFVKQPPLVQQPPYSRYDFRVGPGSPQVPITDKTRWSWTPGTRLHVWNVPDAGEVYHATYHAQLPNGIEDMKNNNAPSGYLLSDGGAFAYPDVAYYKWKPQVEQDIAGYLGKPAQYMTTDFADKVNDEYSSIGELQQHPWDKPEYGDWGVQSPSDFKTHVDRARAIMDKYDLKNSMHKFADWGEIMDNAQELREENMVQILHNGATHVEGIVQSQTSPGTSYQTSFERQNAADTQSPEHSITQWTCTCPWGEVSWGRTRQWKKYEGRPCKHLLALYWNSLGTPLDEDRPEAQGQGQLFDPQQTMPAPAQPGPAPLAPGGGPTPPPGVSPGVMPIAPTGVPAPAPQPPAQSQITQPGQGGTVSLPGTFSKLRESIVSVFENGGTIRNKVPMYGITRDGDTMLVPQGQRGTVLFSDENETIAIFPLDSGILEPHLVRVQEPSVNFGPARGDPFVQRRSKLLFYR